MHYRLRNKKMICLPSMPSSRYINDAKTNSNLNSFRNSKLKLSFSIVSFRKDNPNKSNISQKPLSNADTCRDYKKIKKIFSRNPKLKGLNKSDKMIYTETDITGAESSALHNTAFCMENYNIKNFIYRTDNDKIKVVKECERFRKKNNPKKLSVMLVNKNKSKRKDKKRNSAASVRSSSSNQKSQCLTASPSKRFNMVPKSNMKKNIAIHKLPVQKRLFKPKRKFTSPFLSDQNKSLDTSTEESKVEDSNLNEERKKFEKKPTKEKLKLLVGQIFKETTEKVSQNTKTKFKQLKNEISHKEVRVKKMLDKLRLMRQNNDADLKRKGFVINLNIITDEVKR